MEEKEFMDTGFEDSIEEGFAELFEEIFNESEGNEDGDTEAENTDDNDTEDYSEAETETENDAEADGEVVDDSGEEGADDGSQEVAYTSEKANKRIQKLISEKKEISSQINSLKAEIESLKSDLASDDKPVQPDQQLAAPSKWDNCNPQDEVDNLTQRLESVKTPKMIIDEGLVNPLTGFEYTPAEAQAAVAEHRVSLMQQLAEAQQAVFKDVAADRRSEQLAEEVRVPLANLIDKYPELDRGGVTENPLLVEMLQSVVDTNVMRDSRNRITGFKQDPSAFVDKFEKALLGQRLLKANVVKKVSSKVERESTGRPSGSDHPSTAKKSVDDDLLSGFDDAMESMRFD